MPEHSLLPLCALGSAEPEVKTIGTLTIAENPALAMASLAARIGDVKKVRQSIVKMAKLELPGPGGMVRAGDWSAFWTGPEQWMVTAPLSTHEDLAAIVKAAVGATASVSEQTDGWVRFEITGHDSSALFELLCNVDIHRMAEGQAVRCQIEHLGCFLMCQTSGTAYSLLTLRSAARSMSHALTVAAKAIS